MCLSHHPCIDVNEHEYFSDLFHHSVEEMNNKKTCQAKILEGLDINRDKGICKIRWTLTQKNMEYEDMNEDEVNPNGKHQWCLWM
jgi:hypothetical protein